MTRKGLDNKTYQNEIIFLTPRLSEFEVLHNATSIFQNWLVSRHFANIFHNLNFAEDHKSPESPIRKPGGQNPILLLQMLLRLFWAIIAKNRFDVSMPNSGKSRIVGKALIVAKTGKVATSLAQRKCQYLKDLQLCRALIGHKIGYKFKNNEK